MKQKKGKKEIFLGKKDMKRLKRCASWFAYVCLDGCGTVDTWRPVEFTEVPPSSTSLGWLVQARLISRQ